MTHFLTKKIIFSVALISIAMVAVAIWQASAEEPSPEQAGQNQAMPVSVEIIEPQPVKIWKDYSARLDAVNYAEIRPQVSGVVTEIKFQSGQIVEKGDVLYVIDPRPYKAEVERAQAELNAIYNDIALAKKEVERAENLIQMDALSKSVYDTRQNALKVAQASAGSAKAQLEQAKINLDFAYVKAPITGQVSRDEVKLGNLVEAGPNAPLLTSIVSSQGIFADFEIDEATYIHKLLGTQDAETKIPVRITLNTADRVFEGYIESFDNRINPATGTIRARALFANEDGALLPGMFATVQMGSMSDENQILLTERAIGTDQDRRFVFVVNDENKVEYRPVQTGASMDGMRIILSGLAQGDRVINDGLIRIRPDMVVDPQVGGMEVAPPADKVDTDNLNDDQDAQS